MGLGPSTQDDGDANAPPPRVSGPAGAREPIEQPKKIPRVLIGGVGECGKSAWARRLAEIGANTELPPRADCLARLQAVLQDQFIAFTSLVSTRAGIPPRPQPSDVAAVFAWLQHREVNLLLQQWIDPRAFFLNYFSESYPRLWETPNAPLQPWDHVMPWSHTIASFELWENHGQPFAPVTLSALSRDHLALFNPELVLLLVPLSSFFYPTNHAHNIFTYWRRTSRMLAQRRVAVMFTMFDVMKRLLPHYPVTKWWPTCTARTPQGVARFLIGQFQAEALGTPQHACPMIVTRLTSAAGQMQVYRWVRRLVEVGAPPLPLAWAIGPDPWPRVRLIWLAHRKNRQEPECHIARLPPDIIRKVAQATMAAIAEEDE